MIDAHEDDEEDNDTDCVVHPSPFGIDGCAKSLPVDIGWFNWMRQFTFLSGIVQWRAVTKMKRALDAEGIRYTVKKNPDHTITVTAHMED